MDESEVQRARRVASEVLMEHLAAERLRLEDFEGRVDAVRTAGTVEEVRAALEDLPGRGAAPDRPPAAAVDPHPGTTPRTVWAVSVSGRRVVDLAAEPPAPGATDVRVVCGGGRLEVVVPDDASVEVSVTTAGGTLELDPALAALPDAIGSVRHLRVRGFAVLGEVVIRVAGP